MPRTDIIVPDVLVNAILSIWRAIAPDLGEVDDNETAIQLCLDADRLNPCMGFIDDKGEAEQVHADLKVVHGYFPLLKALAVHPDLQLV